MQNNITAEQEILRRRTLSNYTKDEMVIAELLVYTYNHFRMDTKHSWSDLPFPDAPQIEDWMHYPRAITATTSLYETLKKNLMPLNFPIEKGISNTRYYKEVTLKGKDLNGRSSTTGLPLKKPDELRLLFVEGIVGKIPALIVEAKEDFISLVQALAHKNEPVALPESMGAILIEGLNNWGRLWKNIQRLPPVLTPSMRQEKLKQIFKNKTLYQDRLMIISNQPYSNIYPKAIDTLTWKEDSITIRLQHEYAHYFTKRYFSNMRKNIHDELIADYMGIHAIRSCFDASLFLQFMGLENSPIYRRGGRFENYLDTPSLSPSAVIILQKLLVKAAYNVELFDKTIGLKKNKIDLFARVVVLATFSLVEIASRNGTALLVEKYTQDFSDAKK